MALLRLFFNHSHTIYVKPSFATALKPLVALLHTHGSTSPQGLSPIFPLLVNPLELGLQPRMFLDLAKKSETYGYSNPTVNISSHQYADEMLLKVLEQCHTQIKFLILEGSESKVSEKPKQETEVWADSVKKKRRKKMNKHKYKKLRKRLRRKTKK